MNYKIATCICLQPVSRRPGVHEANKCFIATPSPRPFPGFPNPHSSHYTSMSGPLPANQTPPSKFQSTFRNALREYKRRTREDLLLHPLAARLRSCESPEAILSVLQEQAQTVDQSWNGDEKLSVWLGPTVEALYALSSSLGEGFGLVIIGLVHSARVLYLSCFRYHPLQRSFLLASMSSSL